MFERVGKLFKVSCASLSFKKSAEAAFIVELFRKSLSSVSLELEESIKEISFKDGIVKLKISSASAAAELAQISDSLINDVNCKIGQNLIKRIVYKIT